MRILDLYCGAGGAAAGYQRAGHRVTGVDVDHQPEYPGEFIRADALKVLRDTWREYDFIHASPPCQAHTTLYLQNQALGNGKQHGDHIPGLRRALTDVTIPYVIENVVGAPLVAHAILCGEMFGLRVIRHRVFEAAGFKLRGPAHKKHNPAGVHGWNHGVYREGYYFPVYGSGGGKGTIEDWRNAMGITHITTRHGLAESIPPAYTEYIINRYVEGLS